MRDEAGRFQPGSSGNPNGRPSGQSLTSRLRRKLDTPDTDDPEKLVGEVLVETLIRLAKGGDINALKTIFERTEGRVAGAVEPDTAYDTYQKAAAIIKERREKREAERLSAANGEPDPGQPAVAS